MREAMKRTVRAGLLVAGLLVASSAGADAQYSITATAVVTESLEASPEPVQLRISSGGLTAVPSASSASQGTAGTRVLRRTIVSEGGSETMSRAVGSRPLTDLWLADGQLQRRARVQESVSAVAGAGSGMRTVVVTRVVAANS